MNVTAFGPRIAAVALLAPTLACTAYAQHADGSFARTLTVGDRAEIAITSGSGGIEVRQGPAGRIEVRGKVRAGDWGWNRSRYSAEERVKRVEANPPIEQKGNVIRIGEITDPDVRDGVSITYEVIVPPGSSMRARSGSGSQRIEGVDGQLEASSGSGGIIVRDVGGALHASTGSGSIHAVGIKGAITARSGSGSIDVAQTGAGDVNASSNSGGVRLRGVQGGLRASTSSGGLDVEGQVAGDWRLSSSSGHVTVNVPAKQGFDLDANSNSGRIDVDFPITVSGTIGKHALRGSARGGGPLVHVRTTSGGISIR